MPRSLFSLPLPAVCNNDETMFTRLASDLTSEWKESHNLLLEKRAKTDAQERIVRAAVERENVRHIQHSLDNGSQASLGKYVRQSHHKANSSHQKCGGCGIEDALEGAEYCTSCLGAIEHAPEWRRQGE